MDQNRSIQDEIDLDPDQDQQIFENLGRFRPTALRTWQSVDPWLKVKRKKEKKMNEKEVPEVQEANVQIFH